MSMRVVVLAVFAAIVLPACDRVDNSSYAPAIQELAGSTPEWVGGDALAKRLWAIEQEFYSARGFLPAWVDGDGTTDHMKDLIQQLRYSEAHGFDPAAYNPDEFDQIRERSQTKLRGTRFDPAVVPELDAKLTYAYLRYAADLLAWGTTPRQVFANWLVAPKEEDLAARLEDAIANASIRQSLEELAPSHPQYKGLQAALARERETSSDNVDRILMNLERWRWAPRHLGARYVLVNVPAYQLQVMEGDTPALAMRIIVGEPGTPTPLFSDEMLTVVFSPYWNIPQSIAEDETLPRAARDPDFLLRNNIEVVSTNGGSVDPWSIDWSGDLAAQGLRFRQRPGANNALGLVKFMFPNRFNVYLHDTPGDRLFFREKRAFSHGCIRIENPAAMAEYVLRDQPDWTAERITEAMNARREQAVTLKEKLPVHIGYWTAWVEPDGSVVYTDDPYGIDASHARVRQSQRRHQTSDTAA